MTVSSVGEQKVDLAKAAERLAEAQDGVKLAHAAYQACTKAWDGIRGPSDAKRAMWKALEAARSAMVSSMKVEARHFGVMQTVVGQGDLFNDGAEGEPDGGGVREAAPPDVGGPKGSAGTAIARRTPRRRPGASSATPIN